MLAPSKIQRGDYVIHKAFGIGRFEGLYKKREITIQWDEDGNALASRTLALTLALTLTLTLALALALGLALTLILTLT